MVHLCLLVPPLRLVPYWARIGPQRASLGLLVPHPDGTRPLLGQESKAQDWATEGLFEACWGCQRAAPDDGARVDSG